jgi:regulator of sigma E protease
MVAARYVKISGMIDESMDKEQMALPPQPWEFLL